MSTDIASHNLHKKLVKIVANAWLDPSYKERVLKSPKETFLEAGVELPPNVTLTVVEDTPTNRNLILADRPLPPQNRVAALPPKPDFYSVAAVAYQQAVENPAFKQQLLADPTNVIRALGFQMPPGTTVSVYQDTDTHRYFALPMTPKARISIDLRDQTMAVLDATAVNANVNVNANVQANVNADVNVNAAAQVNGAAVATVVVAVAVLI